MSQIRKLNCQKAGQPTSQLPRQAARKPTAAQPAGDECPRSLHRPSESWFLRLKFIRKTKASRMKATMIVITTCQTERAGQREEREGCEKLRAPSPQNRSDVSLALPSPSCRPTITGDWRKSPCGPGPTMVTM